MVSLPIGFDRTSDGWTSGKLMKVCAARRERRSWLAPVPGIPPVTLDRFDGRSPGSRTESLICLPAQRAQWLAPWRHKDERRSAYSCGGSHGFGPSWVVRTVFLLIPSTSRVGEPSVPVNVERSRRSRWKQRLSPTRNPANADPANATAIFHYGEFIMLYYYVRQQQISAQYGNRLARRGVRRTVFLNTFSSAYDGAS